MIAFGLSDWRQYLKDGEGYLTTAQQAAARKKQAFTPEILYNLTAMAIEKYIMGFLMSRGDLADNHTMGDLLAAMERHIPLPAELAGDLLFLDSFQEICDLDTYSRRPPTSAEIEKILNIGQQIKEFINSRTSH